MNVLVMKGLTLPEVSAADVAQIEEAAGPGAMVTVVDGMRAAFEPAPSCEVVLGFMPPSLFEAARALRWVHATASGVDGFMYPEFRDSDVLLTGEKGLVGGHLADTGFGLLLAITRRIATAIRLGAAGWDVREDMRKEELELEGMTMGIVGFGGTGRAMARRGPGVRHELSRRRRDARAWRRRRRPGLADLSAARDARRVRRGGDLLPAHVGDDAPASTTPRSRR